MSVCSAEPSRAGAAGDQLLSPHTARAVPHRATGQTSLSLQPCFRHLLGQAEGWGRSAVSLLNHWLVGSVVETVVGTSLSDADTLYFKKSRAVLFSVMFLGNCNMPSSGVMRISSSFHRGSSERLPGAR